MENHTTQLTIRWWGKVW